MKRQTKTKISAVKVKLVCDQLARKALADLRRDPELARRVEKHVLAALKRKGIIKRP